MSLSATGDDVRASLGADRSAYNLISGLSSEGAAGGDGHELGELILEGDEDIVVEDGECRRGTGSDLRSAPLSVPATVFLPSDVRSLASGVRAAAGRGAVGRDGGDVGATDGQDAEEALAPRAPCPAPGFSTWVLRVAMVCVVLLLPFTAWRCHVWRGEALRLRKEVRAQRPLVPLALSLLKGHKELLEKQQAPRAGRERPKGERERERAPGIGVDDASCSPDEPQDGSVLSFSEWWYGTGQGSHGSMADWGPINEYGPYEDGFAEDVSTLFKMLASGLATTAKLSLASVERTFRKLSHGTCVSGTPSNETIGNGRADKTKAGSRDGTSVDVGSWLASYVDDW